jgi:Cytochrome c554 and c-prime
MPAMCGGLHRVRTMPSASSFDARGQEWERPLLHCVTALLLFETLTGLVVYLLPFSVPNQLLVLFHTVAGLIFIAPYAWYQARHWRLYRDIRISHVKLTGYLAMAATTLLVVSGLVLTAQAAFATRISRTWDLVHVIGTFGLIASVTPHVLTLVIRAVRARAVAAGARAHEGTRRFAAASTYLSVAFFVPVLIAAFVFRPARFANQLPSDYSFVYGPDRPFAPSLARTASGGAYDARSLSGSESCGASGCHREIYDEWSASAHRYAAMDPAFQKVQSVMGTQNGPESTRYCGGCHDPISLFSGAKNIFNKDLTNLAGYQEGVSCLSCHAIEKTDVKGNAAYVMSQPARYLFELDTGRVSRAVSYFLIRAYPAQHVASLQRKAFKSPEFCAACHKQFIDEQINKVGWVQLQNQYDNWRKSRWNHPGDPRRTVECRECHMPLSVSDDPARGDDRDYNRTPDDGMHRSHRFLGANQFIPTVLGLPGAAKHVRLVEKWLRGEIPIPEIAGKWRNGPAVPLELVTPASVVVGHPLTIQAVVTNNKTGHDFPTGPLDIIQAWVEVTVTDQVGRIVYQSGQRDSAHFIAPGSFMFKSEPVDQYGNLIDRHNLWEMVGVRYRRSVFPGFSDREQFTFVCPGSVVEPMTPPSKTLRSNGAASSPLDRSVSMRVPARVTELHVTARLMYRKADQFLLNFLFGRESGLTAPVTEMSADSTIIRVITN